MFSTSAIEQKLDSLNDLVRSLIKLLEQNNRQHEDIIRLLKRKESNAK